MWENETRKSIIRNVIIALVLIGAVGGLLMAMKAVSQQINDEDKKLSEAHSNQQQQQVDEREDTIAWIKQEYQTDMDTVAKYMPGIVCWGDSLTTGSSGNVSFPYTLQKYINVYLCDIYQFHMSIPNAESYHGVDWDDFKVSIPVVNMGGGRENGPTVLGRAGVEPYVVKKDFVIPAGVEPVAVSIEAPDGQAVSPLTAGSVGMNPITIAGVEGTLSLETVYGVKNYFFERTEPGTEVTVEKGTPIIVACADDYKDYIHVVWLGSHCGYITAKDLVSQTKRLLERQSQNPDRYIVIGPVSFNGGWTGDTIQFLDNVDTAMMQAFGSHYINARKYLIEDGLNDAGLSPVGNDTQQISQGYVPESFRGNNGSGELNGKAYDLIGKLVYQRMERLGYFEEIRRELYIDEVTREILRTVPKYFETQLNIAS